MAQKSWTGWFIRVISRNGGKKMIKGDAFIKDSSAFFSVNCENFDVD